MSGRVFDRINKISPRSQVALGNPLCPRDFVAQYRQRTEKIHWSNEAARTNFSSMKASVVVLVLVLVLLGVGIVVFDTWLLSDSPTHILHVPVSLKPK